MSFSENPNYESAADTPEKKPKSFWESRNKKNEKRENELKVIEANEALDSKLDELQKAFQAEYDRLCDENAANPLGDAVEFLNKKLNQDKALVEKISKIPEDRVHLERENYLRKSTDPAFGSEYNNWWHVRVYFQNGEIGTGWWDNFDEEQGNV
ncbi:hypothetical protein GF376_04630 [Candidatus Peregrinibacteria bacterium]|nr:hypothetical protein [Candidatus Peregrinibacteria bacterium]